MPFHRFAQLPPETLEQILYITDPETFASLVLVSHAWRAASQTPHLYAYHLSRCPSFSINNNVIAGPFTDDSLTRLKRQFAQEVKRNLFESYLRPRHTVVNLISTTTSSSAAFPGGEAFDFSFSPNGHWTLALCSSRIYVIDTVSPKVSIQRELKVTRRPTSATILDNGYLLAVSSGNHRVNVYDLSELHVKHVRSISLENPPNTIALSPKGEVLAATYEGGIELHSLATHALSTDRRTVKCDSVDCLAFSDDGTMLLGTTQNSKNPNTVILSAPYYAEGNEELQGTDLISSIWTSQILFPNSSRDCSHASLLPHLSEGDASWTFTYDRVFESFRAVRTDDLRNGTTYFTGPKPAIRAGPGSTQNKLIPRTLPSTSDRGELVAAGFRDKDIWLYGVPESLDIASVSQTDEASSQGIVMAGSNGSSSAGRSPAKSLTRGESAELETLPQWQVLVDKYRNVFAKGRRIAEVPGVTAVCWVSRKHERRRPWSTRERLIIAAPGGISRSSDLDKDDFAPVDGGRLVLLDFDRTAIDGMVQEMTLEVGGVSPELLHEEDVDMDTEVALIRQRTVRKRREGPSTSTVAAALTSAPDVPALPEADSLIAAVPSSVNGGGSSGPRSMPSAFSPTDGLTLEEASMAFDGPYSHTQPRSRTSLYRSATAVAANRERNPPRLSSGHVQFRRADGRGELPHESDADNWVPPPPAYTPNPDGPLPDHLLSSLQPRATEPVRRASQSTEQPLRARTMYVSPVQDSPTRRISSFPNRPYNNQQRHDSIVSPQSVPTEDSSDSPSHFVSPLSSLGLSYGAATGFNEVPNQSPRRGSASHSRRPVSAFVGRTMKSVRRPQTARLTSPISPIPEPRISERFSPGYSVSLPSSPISGEFPISNLTLSGANLQQRLDYPLPPAPDLRDSESPVQPTALTGEELPSTVPSSTQAHDFVAASMPSAAQLANLRNRYQRPVSQAARPLPLGIAGADYSRSSPPRGALGAAGGTASPSRRLSLVQRNSSAVHRNSHATASSPALPRPSPQRLETIQSVSSLMSYSRTRSRSADILHPERLASRRRSRTAGPVAREGAGKRGWLGARKGKRGKVESRGEAAIDEAWVDGAYGADKKGGKCVLM